ncbi:MAG: DJ-1/PfpI family protein, partial [Oscillospiraceae bacterium]|nr:DJ-1/PfpI family protein [Oscillospiraceae bacterium]
MTVYIVLGTGFEEMEAVVPCDLLRRAGVDARFVGIGNLEIRGSRGIIVKADCPDTEAKWEEADMIVLPGGLGGVASILGSTVVMDAVKKAHADGRFVAAICAAP